MLPSAPVQTDTIRGSARSSQSRRGAGSVELSVISPTYNEAENVSGFVKAVCAALEGSNYEILIVDDDSPDLTWQLAGEIAKQNPRLRVVRRSSQRGLGHAVLQGFSQARGKLVACIDADLQHDPSILSQMVLELRKGCDVAVGSRYVLGGGVHKWSWVRRLMSWIATKAAQVCIRVKLSDPMSGYFMMRREDFLAIREQLNPEGFKILLEILAKLKPEGIAEIPYTFRARIAGQSKLSTKVALEYAQQLARLSKLTSALGQFVKFGLVGVLGIAVNLISMALVIRFCGYRDWRASALATSLAMLHNYLLNNVWTFRDRKHTGSGFLRGCLLYIATCSIGLLLTTGVYSGLTATLAKLVYQGKKAAGLPASALLFSQCIGVLFGAVSNFLLSATITWRSKGARVEKAGAHSLPPGTPEPTTPATSWAKTEGILGAGSEDRGLRPVSTGRIDG